MGIGFEVKGLGFKAGGQGLGEGDPKIGMGLADHDRPGQEGDLQAAGGSRPDGHDRLGTGRSREDGLGRLCKIGGGLPRYNVWFEELEDRFILRWFFLFGPCRTLLAFTVGPFLRSITIP